MDSRDWKILKTLYKEKNLTKAGQKLFLSQPAITYRIRQLEKDFNINILFTEDKIVTFTPEGEQLAEYAIQMLLEEQKVRDNIMNLGTELTGVLKLGVSNSYAQYKLPAILKGFLSMYPGVRVILKTSFSNNIMNLLHNNEIHIAIENIGYDWDGPKLSIGKEKIIVISKDKITLDELTLLPMIKYTKNPFLKTLIDDWWSKNFKTPPIINIEANYSGTCKEMVKTGLGFAIIPEFSIDDNDHLHIINLLDQSGNCLERDNWINFRNSSLKLSVVNAFVEYITSFNRTT